MNVTLEDIVSLCKRRGFIYPGSEIYGGLAGTFDYGPLGIELKNNIKQLWWRTFVSARDDMYGMDAAILMNPKAWEASGHTTGFSDPVVVCANGHPWRVDHLLESQKPEKGKILCPYGGCRVSLGTTEEIQALAKPFNMMFQTNVGASDKTATALYLRPETAGGMFVNFKNVIDSFHPRLPFGLAQIGKAFRNEIAPRDFVFRSREVEQMEIEYFVKEEEWEEHFEAWRKSMLEFASLLGISDVKELEVADADRAHYSKHTIDFEFEYPFGQKELWGLAYRTDFDLSAHEKTSGVGFTYLDVETKEKITPHVIEPSLGVDRTVLAVLCSAYDEDELGGEKRAVLRLSPKVAPVKAMVSPLLKNKPELVAKAKEVRAELKKIHPAIAWDDNGNIGKRYRRQDEIGTPFCITIDFETLENGTITVRDRDTGVQERRTVAEAGEAVRAVLA